MHTDSSQVAWLLQDVCVKVGFCSAARDLEHFEQLVSQGPDAFADAILVKEGMNPEYEKRWRRELRAFVAARFAHWGETGAA